MVTAFILISAERNRIAGAAQEILNLPGISEVYSVAGEWDLIAVVRVPENETLSKLVTEDMIAVPGIVKTTTIFAFRQYLNRTLDQGFHLGD
ncbi:MAG: Lrp/AsnC ligand binding domain-containing protein [Candidatus Omnitrophota bacterium]